MTGAASASNVSVYGQMRIFVARLEACPLSAEHLGLADQATVEADVLQLQLAALTGHRTHDRVPPRDQRAGQHDVVGRVAADVDLRPGKVQHRPAAFVDFVEPDFHSRASFAKPCETASGRPRRAASRLRFRNLLFFYCLGLGCPRIANWRTL